MDDVNDKRLERIEVKIDDLDDQLATISTTLSAQHVSLKEHIRRTAVIEDELKPIRRHVYMINGALILLAALAGSEIVYEVFKRLIK